MFKNSVGLFFYFSTISSLFFLYLWGYFTVVTSKCFRSIPSFSFNRNILSESTIVYTSFFGLFSAYIKHIYIVYSTEVSEFFILLLTYYVLLTYFLTGTNSSLLRILKICLYLTLLFLAIKFCHSSYYFSW